MARVTQLLSSKQSTNVSARPGLVCHQRVATTAVARTFASGADRSIRSSKLPRSLPQLQALSFSRPLQLNNRTLYTSLAVAVQAPVAADAKPNALLSVPNSTFPPYDEITPDQVVPGMRALLADLNTALTALEESVQPTWSGLVEPLERIIDAQTRTWGVVSHLKGVKDSDALRKAVEEVQPENVAFGLRVSQSQALFKAFKALAEGPEYEKLTAAQKRVVELELRDFQLSGIGLEGEAKERYIAIQQELAQLSTKFSNNVLDATKAYKRLVTRKEDLDGLPPSTLALCAQLAKREGHEAATPEAGPWLLTLDFPCYMGVMSHCKNREIRQDMYTTYITRASAGEVDNTPLIDKILSLRLEKSKLLGFANFAELSMASKMADLSRAEGLMEQLRIKSLAAARQDLADVRAFAAVKGFDGELKWWDMSFWAERLREERYSISDEELRPYLALDNVLPGMFKLAKRLFDVEVVPADGEVPVWHPDVRFFKLMQDGKPKAYFYLDPYSRPADKRGGAWMAEVVGQSKLFAKGTTGGDVRLPVATMVCNQSPPVGDKPSLMTFHEVETLFHEFGHALQHMLTKVPEGFVSGIRGIEWDAVELPSQFMENWCYDESTLYSFAKHHQTGQPMPKDMFEKLKAAKNFRSGTMMMRQLHYAMTDLELHSRYVPGSGETIFDRERAVGERTAVLPPFPGDRFLCGFSHIFAGGYSAGYYSYKWAEVLSADAFAAFEEAGLEDESAVARIGRHFRDTVLAMGGSAPAAQVFEKFRGRAPSPEPLLRHSGLVATA